MKNRGIFLVLSIFVLLGFSNIVSAADPGHSAPSIGAGTFEAGDYVFPANLNVSNNLTVNSFVGIGMRASTYSLNVNGIINASGILINGTPLSLGTFNATYDAFWQSNQTIWNAINSVPTSGNQTATYIPYVGASKNSDLGTWNLTASWLKGTFGWIVNTSSTTYLNFNGTNLALTEEVTKWLYNQTTAAATDYTYINSVLQGNLSANITNVYSNINISKTILYNNLTAYVNANVTNTQQRINISATGLYNNITAYTNANLTNFGTRINISATILYNNVTAYTNNQIIGNLTANLSAINSNLTSSFVPYVGASKNVIFGNNNLSIGLGRGTPQSSLDINGSFSALAYEGTGVYSIGRYSHLFGTVVNAGNISSIGVGSIAGGYADTGQITARDFGAVALGYAIGGDIISSGRGSFALGRSNGGLITSSGFGSFALGRTTNGNITSSGQGSLALGYALSGGNIISSGLGSFAGGHANVENITSTGSGSFVWGNASSSSGTNGIVFGSGVQNTLSNSFSVGFGQIGNTPMLFVNNSAIGVNTTNPRADLHVNGDVILNASAVGGNVIIQL